MNNIIVVSYPRSGTHLTLNMINNGFLNYSVRDKLDINKTHDKTIKTHYRSYETNAQKLIDENKVIYVVRDVRDVMVSNFFFRPKYQKMVNNPPKDIKLQIEVYSRKFYNNWKEHINSWFKYENDILIVSYSSLLHDFDNQRKRMEEYLNINIVNTIPKLEDGFVPRKGEVGNYKQFMSEDFSTFLYNACETQFKLINKY